METVLQCQIRIQEDSDEEDEEKKDTLDYIDLENLMEKLCNMAGNEVFAKNKDTVEQIFKSDAFKYHGEIHEKDPNGKTGIKIQTTLVLSLALVTCRDETKGSDTAKVFFELASDGGYENPRNKKVAADDEEMNEALQAMCNLVTCHVIEFYHAMDPKGMKMEAKYDETHFKKLEKAQKKVIEEWLM
jgi:hypothetical protein